MSDLFSEALKDSKKLREVAEQDAKNRIIKELTPYIKEMIAKESAEPSDFFFEQDEELENEEELQQQQQAAAQGQAAVQEPAAEIETTAPQNTTDPTGELGAELGNQGTEAPISPEGEEVVGATMPDEEGKITVDFEDLFIDDGSVTLDKDDLQKATGAEEQSPEEQEVQPAEQPDEPTAGAAAPETATPQEEELPAESISFKEYHRAYSNIAERVDRVFFTESVSDISKESLKQRLFDLLEAVDIMKETGVISNKQARIQENKLEFLFIKLKDAGLHNSYNKENQYKDTAMKSIKEFAAKLFEEDESLSQDSVSTDESGLNVDDEYSEHAADVSGVDPKLGDREDVEASSGPARTKDSVGEDGEKPWNEGEPVVDEEDQADHVTSSMKENYVEANQEANNDVAEGAAGFGDTDEDPSVSYEVDVDELAEAVRDIKKESIRKKMKKLSEASDGEEVESWEDADPEGGDDPSHDKLKEGMDMELSEQEEMSDEELADLVLSIDLPPEVEEELAELGLDDDDVDVDVALNLSDEAADDEEVEIVDDEEDEDGSEEEEALLVDREDPSVTDRGAVEDAVGPMNDPDYGPKQEGKLRHSMRKNKLLEKKLHRAAKLLEKKDNEINEMKKQLVETNLFTAKAVYYSKFLQKSLTEKALNKKVLQQIVEHLDKGRTVAETKAIYKKIDQKLNEHKTASRNLDGSSSAVTKPGSANLTEGRAPQAGHNSDNQLSERWQQLAGIRVKND